MSAPPTNIGDDDQTPAQPPVRLENVPLLAVLSDIILAIHEHSRRLREIARVIRLQAHPVSTELRSQLAEEIESFHLSAAAHARRIREAA